MNWSIDNPKIASVENNVVKAKKAGHTFVRAKVKDKEYVCSVNVQKTQIVSQAKYDTFTPEKGFKGYKNYNEYYSLDEKTVKFCLLGGSVQKWSTSNKKVATIDNNGVATLKKAGTVKIKCTSDKGKAYALKIHVEDPLEIRVVNTVFNSSLDNMFVGDTVTVNVSVSSARVPLNNVEAIVSDTDIAKIKTSVNLKKKPTFYTATITAQKEGSTTISFVYNGTIVTKEINVIDPHIDIQQEEEEIWEIGYSPDGNCLMLTRKIKWINKGNVTVTVDAKIEKYSDDGYFLYETPYSYTIAPGDCIRISPEESEQLVKAGISYSAVKDNTSSSSEEIKNVCSFTTAPQNRNKLIGSNKSDKSIIFNIELYYKGKYVSANYRSRILYPKRDNQLVSENVPMEMLGENVQIDWSEVTYKVVDIRYNY